MSYGTNGSVIGPDNVPTGGSTGVASGVWSLGEMAEAVRDSIWPAPAQGGYEWISGYTLNSTGASSYNFSSIPATYASLQIRIGLTPFSSYGQAVGIQQNGNTTTYMFNGLLTYSSTETEFGNNSFAEPYVSNDPGASAAGVGLYDITKYTLAGHTKTYSMIGGTTYGNSGYQMASITAANSQATDTAAVTSVRVFTTNSTAFQTGSSIHLYGFKDS
jgi:hypothetical protein